MTTVPVPKDALDWFRAKGYRVGFDYREVWQEEHAAAFTVAKAMRLDILEGIRAAMDKALAEGQSFGQFKRELQPLLERMGWWGKQELIDPLEGAEREVQLGSPRRLKTIYNTNLRTAHAAGQWQRIQRAKATHPYLLYQLGPSREHRVEHLSWAGRLLPVDHPWWQTHFPPNGWGCKCHVRAVSKREAERLRAQGAVSETAPDEGEQEYLNQRTGEVLQVPKGIDPGWAYNPGAAGRVAQTLDNLSGKLARADTRLTRAALGNLIGGPAFAEWYRAPTGVFPLAVLDQAVAARLGASTQLVGLSEQTLAKQLRVHPEITLDEYALVQAAIDRGIEVPGNQVNTTVYVLDEVDGYVSVIKVTRDGREVYLTSMRRLSSQQAKRDEEIQRLLNKRDRKADGGASHPGKPGNPT